MRVVSWYYGILGLTGSLLKVAVVDNEGPQDRHGKTYSIAARTTQSESAGASPAPPNSFAGPE